MNNTEHGHQQQQQHQEPQGGQWTRQTARRRKAQHGKRVKPVSPPDSKPAQIQTAKQAFKTSHNHIRDNQRQAASNIADLAPKAASLTEAADRHSRHIKPASWAPTSYSAAVGPASFWADVVTPLVGDRVPIAALLNKYRGSAKYEQLIKLTKGSRPFTQYRSIRGEFAHCHAMRHVDVLTYTFPFMMSIEDVAPMVVMRSVIPVAAILLQLRTLMHKHMHVYTHVQAH